MSSDGEQDEENPILARHRREKKELRGKILAKKKAAKCGNKQMQKEAGAECEKMEKEMDERHKKELEEAKKPEESEAVPAENPEASTLSPPSPNPEGSDNDGEGPSSSAFYKTVKISNKAAKKQDKKKKTADKMKAAEAADKEAGKNQLSDRQMEKAAVKEMLAEDHMKMIDIPADGDCMYNAISHQLQEEGIEISVRKLRKRCGTYMREHSEDFRPFIEDMANMDSDSSWATYLGGVENVAEIGGVWGGELELKACSMIFEKTIVVYKQYGGRHTIGEEYSSPKDRALRVVFLRHAYSLGEHYNSTCPY
ncbi:OTU domain-containing protein [Caenorhabditis elegans]|uniref:OTU domain-containing protein n=1 Tax=Caenorhabditis elegans TaxID=6239 RepID=Q19681_CAEEL|nr:OTU domain-containing protein [Caenorhabditis elegans]CAA91033.1 OTU domain-containing protein [Caenorhabditis elegans]|eukprot:NP_001255318.1 OTUBain deubiquitylating protease homolog [Caenorhabditis elegans]